ncbi:MAG: glycosyltransferase family 4 protein [Gammaproteobacteria bacterium]|nr:glycosyltransferase family 4 protein [Gammaproteobacteria bacterium]
MDNKPSILFTLPWSVSATGGVNQVVLNLARETERRGQMRPIIVCSDWDQEGFRFGEIDGITTVSTRLRTPVASKHAIRNLAGFAFTMRKSLATWQDFMRHHRVRVVNAHYAISGYLLFSLLRRQDRADFRLIHSLHGADLSGIQAAGAATRATDRWMLRQADHVVCCSDDLSLQARATLNIDPVPVSTVHNGIDFAELDHAKHHAYRPHTGEFDNYLVNVASFTPEKGQDVLIDAFAILVREGLQSALVLIGRSTPHLATLRQQVRKLGLHERVFFITDLDHARTLAAIRKARLFVLPSRAEPFGIVLLEAAYMRTPIVATQSGGVPEVLGRYYPHLVKPDDPAALAQTIDDTLFNPTETQRLVRQLRRQVGSRFSWSRAYDSYEQMWRDAY